MDKSSGGNGIKKKISRDNRPQFPEKAVVTGGMPYGNKKLHFGHVGGVFVFADVFARFLRDRIGRAIRVLLRILSVTTTSPKKRPLRTTA